MSEEQPKPTVSTQAIMFYRCAKCGLVLTTVGYRPDLSGDICLHIEPCEVCSVPAEITVEPVPVASLEGLCKRVKSLEDARTALDIATD